MTKPSFPTPLYATDDEGDVYPPAEDSFLLLDALESEAEFIRDVVHPEVVLEIGCGSGVVSAFIRQTHAPATSFYSLATDLNFQAATCSHRTAEMNIIPRSKTSIGATGQGECVADRLDIVQCDLLKPLQNRLRGQIDVVVFNPPYVCTDQPAQLTSELYYAGGPQGRNEVERLLDVIPEMLSDNGVFYVVALRQNNIPEMLRMFEPQLQGSVIIERRCGIEHLFVLKYTRSV